MPASVVICGEHDTTASQGTFTFCSNGASIPSHKLNVIQKDFLMGKSKQSEIEIKWSELVSCQLKMPSDICLGQGSLTKQSI